MFDDTISSKKYIYIYLLLAFDVVHRMKQKEKKKKEEEKEEKSGTKKVRRGEENFKIRAGAKDSCVSNR